MKRNPFVKSTALAATGFSIIPSKRVMTMLKRMKNSGFKAALLLCCMNTISYSQSGNNLLLKNYRPISIYKTNNENIHRAVYPAIDMHSHDYAATEEDIDTWVKTMDAMRIQKTILLTYKTGKAFDSVVEKYSRYPTRFELWCGFDYTGYNTTGWQQHAIAELERCYKKGARGVGEFADKGEGDLYSKLTPGGMGLHIDDLQLKPLLEKSAGRYSEIAPIPRYAATFITKYQNRLLYGTDMGFAESMYKTTFRILETADEHFYEIDLFNYHWPLYGLHLPKSVLLKLYKTNAEKILIR